jgi:uncharacterized membrane protein YphA (DoxX/SURF4 family)
MKALVNISRIIVGILFIFSGLIKANDPLGLSYKMQEFFEVWGMHALNDYTLLFSLLMNGFEIVAGVAVLLGWRMRLFSWLLLLLIIFFTFLTGYALLSGKIKTCGCFGDCIPLTAAQSFMKDLLLLALIIFIFVKRDLVQPLLPSFLNGFIILLVIVFCVIGQYYVLNHLPVFDCLPYKKGNNLLQQMKQPEGAVADSFEIRMKYRKDGKDVEFDMDHFPDDFNDSTYQFVDRYQKLVRKGTAAPPIADLVLYSEAGTDTTQAVLNQPNKYIMLLVKDAAMANSNWIRHASMVAKAAAQKNIPVLVVTATLDEAKSQLYHESNIQFIRCDATVIKTAARVNPTYFLMQQATVLGKYADVDFKQVISAIQ